MIPPEHVSHDHLNEQKDIPIEDAIFQKWKTHFERVEQEHQERGQDIKWVMVDGFLLYWDPVSEDFSRARPVANGTYLQQVVETLEQRILLRVPHDVLKKRRHDRHGYHTAGRDSFVRCPREPRTPVLTRFLPLRLPHLSPCLHPRKSEIRALNPHFRRRPNRAFRSSI